MEPFFVGDTAIDTVIEENEVFGSVQPVGVIVSGNRSYNNCQSG